MKLWKQITLEVILAIIVFFFVLQYVFTGIRADVAARGSDGLVKSLRVLQSYMKETNDLVYITASTADEIIDNGLPNSEIHRVLKDFYEEDFPHINMDIDDIYGHVQGEYLDGSGWQPDESFIPFMEEWYLKAMENPGESVITSPYHSKRNGELMVAFAHSLKDGKGVIAADISLESVERLAENLYNNGIHTFYLVDNNGSLIRFSEGRLSSRENTDRKEYIKLKEFVDASLRSDETYLKAYQDERLSYIFSTEVFGGWHVVAVMDVVNEYLAKARYFVYAVVGVSALTALLIIATILIYRRKRVAENLARQLAAAAGIYKSMHVIDIDTDTFTELNSMEDVSDHLGAEVTSASMRLRRLMENTVLDTHLEAVLDFVEIRTLAERMKDKRTITIEFQGIDTGWCRGRFVEVKKDKQGYPTRVLFAIEVIDEEKRRENQLRYLSEMDGLTGINNRATGERMIKDLIASSIEGLFCLLDADKFKSVNDNYGHQTGDQVIISIANALKKTFRDKDIVLRLGGDEFAFYAVGVTDEETANRIMERFFKAIDDIHIEKLGDRKICVSVGGTFFKADSTDMFEDIYSRADLGTYKSKEIEGNAFSLIKENQS